MKIILALAAVAALSGCASVSAWFATPTGQDVVNASVLVAVATAEQKGVSAIDINRIAKLALAADSGTAGTLAALSTLVNAEVAKLKLPAADLAAAQILEVALSAAISTKLNGNATLAATQAAVALVLADVVAASGG